MVGLNAGHIKGDNVFGLASYKGKIGTITAFAYLVDQDEAVISGFMLSSASISPCGIEKGLWLKSIFFASSSYSNIGKSTIQQNSKRFLSIRSSSVPIRVRVTVAGAPSVLVDVTPAAVADLHQQLRDPARFTGGLKLSNRADRQLFVKGLDLFRTQPRQ